MSPIYRNCSLNSVTQNRPGSDRQCHSRQTLRLVTRVFGSFLHKQTRTKNQQTWMLRGSGYCNTESNTEWWQTNMLGVYRDEMRMLLTKCLGNMSKEAWYERGCRFLSCVSSQGLISRCERLNGSVLQSTR